MIQLQELELVLGHTDRTIERRTEAWTDGQTLKFKYVDYLFLSWKIGYYIRREWRAILSRIVSILFKVEVQFQKAMKTYGQQCNYLYVFSAGDDPISRFLCLLFRFMYTEIDTYLQSVSLRKSSSRNQVDWMQDLGGVLNDTRWKILG